MSQILISSYTGNTKEQESSTSAIPITGHISRTLMSFYLDCEPEELIQIEMKHKIKVIQVPKKTGISESYSVEDFPLFVADVANLPNRPDDDILKEIDTTGNFEIAYKKNGSVLKFVKE